MSDPTSEPSAAASSTTPKLFVRQSSGLVRNVSVTNALFFNVAAFVGVGLTLYPIFYSLPDVPVWKVGPFSAYGWAAIIAGLFCVLLAMIFSSLTSVMPRSGGDYVFTSRIIHPFARLDGVVHAGDRVGADHRVRGAAGAAQPADHRADHRHRRRRALLQAREHVVHRLDRHDHRHARVHRLARRAGWDRASIGVLPTRTFHKVVTLLAGYGVACFVAMFIFGLIATHKASFDANLPKYTGGVTSAKIAASGVAAGVLRRAAASFVANIFSTTVFPLVLSVLLFQYIGFQYSAYIAGEVRGNVRRGVLIALLGALVIGVFANSVYVDVISTHFGFKTNVSWGASYWGFSTAPLPLGQPNAMPLLAVIANKSLWPIWALIASAGRSSRSCCARCTSTSSAGCSSRGASTASFRSGSATSTSGCARRSTRSSRRSG